MTNSSLHSSVKSQNPIFVPSPRWLSESPANRQGYAGPGTSISDHSTQHQGPSFAPNLKSPIPPPPANLYPGSPAAFNVDPGIPFLATAGPTSDGSSSDASNKHQESPRKGFGGGLMSGIKLVVRRSLRDRTRSHLPENPAIYIQPPEFRDSGYAESDPTPRLPQPHATLAPPHMPEPAGVSSPPSSRRTIHSVRPPSETLLGHQDDGDDRDEATMIGHHNSFSMGTQKRKPSYREPRLFHYTTVQNNVPEMPPLDERQRPQAYPDIVPPDAILSPVSAELKFGENYMQMRIDTPPPSDASFNTYVKRFQKIVHDVNALPWIRKDRITADYYPEKSRRSDEPKRHPAIVWRSEAFTKPASDPKAPSDHNDSSPSISGESPGLRAPRRGSYTGMDLGAEFEDNYPPLPINPPGATQGSLRNRAIPPEKAAPPDSMLLQAGPPPILPPAPIYPIPSAVHVTYESYPQNPPNNGQWNETKVPQFYIPPPWELAAPRPPSVVQPLYFIPPVTTSVPSVASRSPPLMDTASFAIPPISTNAPSLASPSVPVPRFNIPPASPNARYSPPIEPSPGDHPFSDYVPNPLPAETTPVVPPFSTHVSSPSSTTPVIPLSMNAPTQSPHLAPPFSPVVPYSPSPETTPVIPLSTNVPYTSPRTRQSPVASRVSSKRPPTPWVSSPGQESPSEDNSAGQESPPVAPFVPDRDEWEAYPMERTGYVPYQYSEHYYGDQYGAGIHPARPPLVQRPTSSDSS